MARLLPSLLKSFCLNPVNVGARPSRHIRKPRPSPVKRKGVVASAARLLEVLRARDIAQVGLGHGDHLANAAVQNGTGSRLREAHELLDGQRRWQGEGVGVSNDVDKSRAVISQRLLDLLRCVLSDPRCGSA